MVQMENEEVSLTTRAEHKERFTRFQLSRPDAAKLQSNKEIGSSDRVKGKRDAAGKDFQLPNVSHLQPSVQKH